MSISANDDKDFPADIEACYETLASQEEIYLEEREEELHVILDAYVASPSRNESMTDAHDSLGVPDSLKEQLEEAAEALSTEDADESLFSKEEILEILRLI